MPLVAGIDGTVLLSFDELVKFGPTWTPVFEVAASALAVTLAEDATGIVVGGAAAANVDFGSGPLDNEEGALCLASYDGAGVLAGSACDGQVTYATTTLSHDGGVLIAAAFTNETDVGLGSIATTSKPQGLVIAKRARP